MFLSPEFFQTINQKEGGRLIQLEVGTHCHHKTLSSDDQRNFRPRLLRMPITIELHRTCLFCTGERYGPQEVPHTSCCLRCEVSEPASFHAIFGDRITSGAVFSQ